MANIPWGNKQDCLGCGGGGGGGDVSTSNDGIVMYDDQGGGIYIPFIRRIDNNGSGGVTITDTELDGTTPYVVSGTEIPESLFLVIQSVSSTTSNITPNELNVNGVGSTTAGIYLVSVFNSGGANGTFNGVTIFPGSGREYRGYEDPNTNDFKRLASYNYDATGTTFEISETP